MALYVPASLFVQKLVEGMLHIPRVAFVDQHSCEVRPGGEGLAIRLYFFKRDRNSEGVELFDQAAVAVTTAFEEERQPFAETPQRGVFAREVPEQMDRHSLIFRGELYPADQPQASGFRVRHG